MMQIPFLKSKRTVVAIAILSLFPAYYWLFGQPLFFRIEGDRQVATFERQGKHYTLSKFESDGSGNYTLYTLSTLDKNHQRSEQEFTTCGKFKLEADRILFIEPYQFHCGILFTPINELMGKSTVQVVKF
jgi:hypothetical protein